MKKDMIKEDIEKLRRMIQELEYKCEDAGLMEEGFDKTLSSSNCVCLPEWVRDLFRERILGHVGAYREEINNNMTNRASLESDLSTASLIRFVVYFATKYPDAIDYVSLRELWALKKELE